MGWLPAVLGVLSALQELIPTVERLLPVGGGKTKHGIAACATDRMIEQLLPGVTITPEIQAAITHKIQADVALLNLLQRATASGSSIAAGGGSLGSMTIETDPTTVVPPPAVRVELR